MPSTRLLNHNVATSSTCSATATSGSSNWSAEVGIAQPSVSKHLKVLREVHLVQVREAGRQRIYGLDARGLRPVHEWVGGFEEFWNESFGSLNAYVRKLERAATGGYTFSR